MCFAEWLVVLCVGPGHFPCDEVIEVRLLSVSSYSSFLSFPSFCLIPVIVWLMAYSCLVLGVHRLPRCPDFPLSEAAVARKP